MRMRDTHSSKSKSELYMILETENNDQFSSYQAPRDSEKLRIDLELLQSQNKELRDQVESLKNEVRTKTEENLQLLEMVQNPTRDSVFSFLSVKLKDKQRLTLEMPEFPTGITVAWEAKSCEQSCQTETPLKLDAYT